VVSTDGRGGDSTSRVGMNGSCDERKRRSNEEMKNVKTDKGITERETERNRGLIRRDGSFDEF
jgi:hypothetical protein